MCTTQRPIDPATGRFVTRLVPQAKIHLDGKRRPLFVTEEVREVTERVDVATGNGDAFVQLTDLNGKEIQVRTERVGTVKKAYPRPAKTKVPRAGELDGKGVKVRGMRMTDLAEFPHGELNGRVINALVLVTAEDLAAADVLVYDSNTDEVVWVNPAAEEQSVVRYTAVARLCCEAEGIQAAGDEEAYAPPAVPGTVAVDTGSDVQIVDPTYGEVTPEQATALAHLERGERMEAITAAGEAFVEKIEREGASPAA